MKKILQFSFFACALLLLGCSGGGNASKEGVKISGVIKQPISGEDVLVERLTTVGIEVIDTVEFDADGSFVTYLDLEESAFLRFNFFGRQYVSLIATGQEEDLRIEVDGDRPEGFAEVTGSPETDLLEMINEAQEKRKSDEGMLNQEAIQAKMKGDNATFNQIL